MSLFGFEQIDKIQFQKGEQIEQVTKSLAAKPQTKPWIKKLSLQFVGVYVPFSFNVIFSLHHFFPFIFHSFLFTFFLIFILRFSTHTHKHIFSVLISVWSDFCYRWDFPFVFLWLFFGDINGSSKWTRWKWRVNRVQVHKELVSLEKKKKQWNFFFIFSFTSQQNNNRRKINVRHT